MEGMVFGWLWSLIWANGALTPIAGSAVVLIALGGIVKYFIHPAYERLNRIEAEIIPDVHKCIIDVKIIVDAILANQLETLSDTALHNKMVFDIDKDLESAKSTLNKLEAMISVMSISTSRGLK